MKMKSLKLGLASLLAMLFLNSGAAWSEEYIYRDLMGNTLPPQRCLEKKRSHLPCAGCLSVEEKGKSLL